MTILIRVVEWSKGKEYGLDHILSTETIDLCKFDVVCEEIKRMRAVIQRDIDERSVDKSNAP